MKYIKVGNIVCKTHLCNRKKFVNLRKYKIETRMFGICESNSAGFICRFVFDLKRSAGEMDAALLSTGDYIC